MKLLRHLSILLLSSFALFAFITSTNAMPQNTFTPHMYVGIGANTNFILSSKNSYVDDNPSFSVQKTSGSGLGYNFIVGKEFTPKLGLVFQYSQLGTVKVTNEVTGKTNQEVKVNQFYVNFLGKYNFALDNSLNLFALAGGLYHHQKSEPNAAAKADSYYKGQDDQTLSNIGFAFGGGLAYHVNHFTTQFELLTPEINLGYVSLNFLYNF